MGSHTGRLTNEIVGFNMLDSSQYGSGYTTTTGSISGPQVLQLRKMVIQRKYTCKGYV
jgi:hypothetical protein